MKMIGKYFFNSFSTRYNIEEKENSNAADYLLWIEIDAYIFFILFFFLGNVELPQKAFYDFMDKKV